MADLIFASLPAGYVRYQARRRKVVLMTKLEEVTNEVIKSLYCRDINKLDQLIEVASVRNDADYMVQLNTEAVRLLED